MAKICSYPQCQKCEYEYCIKDSQKVANSTQKQRDRREYYKKYYRRTKGSDNAHKRANYWYINKKQTLDVIRQLKKKIGQLNAQIIIDALDQLETKTIDE